MAFEIKTGISRRRFFKWLGVGAAAAVVAPSALAVMEPSCARKSPWDGEYGYHYDTIRGDEYADYTDFSSFSHHAALDEIVENAGKELSEQAARSIVSMRAPF